MQRISSKVTHIVDRMTDPHPTFVSLVEHGANQTPFKVVKAHLTDMTPETHKFVFKKAQFANEDAVKAYLSTKGFTDPTIEAADDTFVCIFRQAGDFTEVKEVECEDGVTQFVGSLSEDAEQTQKTGERQRTPVTKTETPPVPETPPAPETPPEPEAPVQPVATLKAADGQEFVKKFDSWVAYYGGQLTIEDAIAKATESDGNVPIGYYELRNVFDDVIRNNLKEGKLENLDAVAIEFVSAVKKLHGLFAVVQSQKSDAAEKVSKALFAAERNPSVETPATTQKTEGTPSETPPAPETPEPTEPEPETPPTPEVPPAPEEADPVAKAVAKAFEGMTAKMTELLSPIKQSIEDVTKRVEGMEAPSRKSADETELPNPAGDKTTKTDQPDAPKKSQKGWDTGSGVF